MYLCAIALRQSCSTSFPTSWGKQLCGDSCESSPTIKCAQNGPSRMPWENKASAVTDELRAVDFVDLHFWGRDSPSARSQDRSIPAAMASISLVKASSSKPAPLRSQSTCRASAFELGFAPPILVAA